MIFPGLINISFDVDEPVVFVVKLYNLSKERANKNYSLCTCTHPFVSNKGVPIPSGDFGTEKQQVL